MRSRAEEVCMLRFKVQTKVVYPAQGVAEVIGFETKEIDGRPTSFYVLRMLGSGTRVLVPALRRLRRRGLRDRQLLLLERVGLHLRRRGQRPMRSVPIAAMARAPDRRYALGVSKAFTKETDEGLEDVLQVDDASLPPGTKNYATPAGAARLRADIERLRAAPREDA